MSRRPTKPPRKPVGKPSGPPGRARAPQAGDKRARDKRAGGPPGKRPDERSAGEKRFGSRRPEGKPLGEKRSERHEGRSERPSAKRLGERGEGRPSERRSEGKSFGGKPFGDKRLEPREARSERPAFRRTDDGGSTAKRFGGAGRPERKQFDGDRATPARGPRERPQGARDEREPRARQPDTEAWGTPRAHEAPRRDRFGDKPKSRRSGAREQERSQRREKPRSFAPRPAEERTVDKSSPHRSPRPPRAEAERGAGAREPQRHPALADRVSDLVEALEALPTAVQTVTVTADENDMRVDRFLEARFPGLSFSHIQRIVRKGELRVNSKRADSKDRLKVGQAVRIPPLKLDAPKAREGSESEDEKNRAFLKSITLYEDADVLVLNKPFGLAVQGGSGTTRHVDGMLEALRDRSGQKPRLVHRIDKDTAGCLLVAKTRFAASTLAKSFRSRDARKVYWALVVGVPRPHQGRISTYLAKEEIERDSFMRVAQHGEDGASHAITYYAVVETAAQKLAWISLKPVTGRTHQLRAHCAHIEHPIVGDPKYFSIENWELPGGIQNRLHLLARRIALPHPRGGTIDVTAPLPLHMQQSWNLLGFDANRFDPIVDAPEK